MGETGGNVKKICREMRQMLLVNVSERVVLRNKENEEEMYDYSTV